MAAAHLSCLMSSLALSKRACASPAVFWLRALVLICSIRWATWELGRILLASSYFAMAPFRSPRPSHAWPRR